MKGAIVELRSAQYQKTGRLHQLRGEDCQDVILQKRCGGLDFYGLADGQSGKRCCVEGGRRSLQAVCGYLLKQGLDRLRSCEHTDEIQYEIIKIVRDNLRALAAERGEKPEEFASTMVILAVDRQTGQYMAVHLGDGGILGIRRDGGTTAISAPENADTGRCTWLTTSRGALTHVRIVFGNVQHYKKLLIYTDGVGRVRCRGGEEERIMFRLNSEPADDASCIVVCCEVAENGAEGRFSL